MNIDISNAHCGPRIQFPDHAWLRVVFITRNCLRSFLFAYERTLDARPVARDDAPATRGERPSSLGVVRNEPRGEVLPQPYTIWPLSPPPGDAHASRGAARQNREDARGERERSIVRASRPRVFRVHEKLRLSRARDGKGPARVVVYSAAVILISVRKITSPLSDNVFRDRDVSARHVRSRTSFLTDDLRAGEITR